MTGGSTPAAGCERAVRDLLVSRDARSDDTAVPAWRGVDTGAGTGCVTLLKRLVRCDSVDLVKDVIYIVLDETKDLYFVNISSRTNAIKKR
ncbi:hypothetical protein JYU34_013192 [Plutella xylostella]|uniref:Uncharacterized protein n=1 Tax=Plutella xylostella TaxID=51655 RepID=A0ABQ7QGU3_PLUXY|nr:hypothetical protein JYU34_013192 [Plutella xylostella]